MMKAWAFLAGVMMLGGCSATLRLGQFTAASSNNVRNLKYDTKSQTKTRTTGETCITYVFGFPSGDFDSRLQRAMDNAIKNGQDSGVDGDLLVNVRIDNEYSSYWLYGTDCMIVTGDLVKVQE